MTTPADKDALRNIHRIQTPSDEAVNDQDASNDESIPANETDAMRDYNLEAEKIRITKWIVVLMFLGYGIPAALVLLAGWKIYDFDLDPWVLTPTIVSMTSSVTYMMRNVLTAMLSTN